MRAFFWGGLLASIAVSAHAVSPAGGFDQSQVLGGDEGDACEMLLCLSNPAGKGLVECQEPLKKYFSMKPKKRPGFLEKCPLQGGSSDD